MKRQNWYFFLHIFPFEIFLSILTNFYFSTSEPVLSLPIYEATELVIFFAYFSILDVSKYIDNFYFFNIRTSSVASYIWSDRTGCQYTQKCLKRKNMWKKVPVLSLHIVEATEPVLFFTYFSISDISEYIDKFYFFNIRTGSVASYIWSNRTGCQ